MDLNCPGLHNPTDPSIKTSDFYKTCGLPKRMEYPSWFYGYGIQKHPPDNPLYLTSSSVYGRYPPTIHTVVTSYFPTCQDFSNSRGLSSGNYRNYSLNTGLDRSPV
ncbi:unnamed protein product [Phyllotreta striolata]|uniref:Uncharacterized protein n=1 Tax=Phyllotreta striolata TaxID=444603 RepID=A0A9N9TPF5_PHYSR|nr:unnamed protein product [Phyllotreta striolata]